MPVVFQYLVILKKSLTINYENIIKVYDDDVAAIIITHTHLINAADIEKIKAFTKEKIYC